MFRSMCFCLALVSTATAYAQQRVQLPNGQVGTFFAEAQPDPNGYVPIQQRQVVPPQGQGRHDPHCNCEVCRERVLSQEEQIESKTIERRTVVTVIEKTHPTVRRALPVQQQMAPDPCVRPQNPYPPQDPCLQQRQGSGSPLPTWNNRFLTHAEWCAQQNAVRIAQQRQQPRGFFAGWRPPLVSANAGVAFAGFGPQLNASIGNQTPPYAQSGQVYGGNQPWYGGGR